MLHEETLEAGTLALIRTLSADNRLNDFVLVGGTALALQLGHRKSIDIDLFTPHPFYGEMTMVCPITKAHRKKS
jgi:hypothetical protein